jgi:hypothetical protein
MTDAAVVKAYNAAYKAVITDRGGRSPAWSRVCHPIGQLLGYMVENGRRYGVLTSATRAYFLWIEGDGELAEVRISTPWFVDERDFLREWAFVHSMACQQSVPLVASSLPWKLTSKDDNKPTTPPTSKRKHLRSDGILLEGNEDEESEGVNGDEMSTNGQEDAPAGSAAQMSALVETLIEKTLKLSKILGMDAMELCFWTTGMDRRLPSSSSTSERTGMNTLTSSIGGCLGPVGAHTPVCVRVLGRLDQVYWLAAGTRSATRGRYFGTDRLAVDFRE